MYPIMLWDLKISQVSHSSNHPSTRNLPSCANSVLLLFAEQKHAIDYAREYMDVNLTSKRATLKKQWENISILPAPHDILLLASESPDFKRKLQYEIVFINAFPLGFISTVGVQLG